MKHIGILIGTFNPIHNGHLLMAETAFNFTDLEQIIFVPSPLSPFKVTNNLVPFEDRCNMIQCAISPYKNFSVSRIEEKLDYPTYTYKTLAELSKEYENDCQLSLIIGGDNFQNIEKWRNFETILENYPIIVIERNHIEVQSHRINLMKNYKVLDIQTYSFLSNEISSSIVRNLIRENKLINSLVPLETINYINKHNLYKI